MIDLDELRKRAEAATKGPWRVEQGTTLVWGKCDPDDKTTYGMGVPVAETKPHQGWGSRRGLSIDDAEASTHFIAAANPSVVLELIERVEMAEAEAFAMSAGMCMIRAGVEYRLRTTISGDNDWYEDTDRLYRVMMGE